MDGVVLHPSVIFHVDQGVLNEFTYSPYKNQSVLFILGKMKSAEMKWGRHLMNKNILVTFWRLISPWSTSSIKCATHHILTMRKAKQFYHNTEMYLVELFQMIFFFIGYYWSCEASTFFHRKFFIKKYKLKGWPWYKRKIAPWCEKLYNNTTRHISTST